MLRKWISWRIALHRVAEIRTYAIPISYNIRNLKMRKGLTIMTALALRLRNDRGVSDGAAGGVGSSLRDQRRSQNVLVLRKGSTAECRRIRCEFVSDPEEPAGIAKDSHGEPLASGEWVVVIVLPPQGWDRRGERYRARMMPDGLELRQLPKDKPRVKLVEGRWFTPDNAKCREPVHHNRFSHSKVATRCSLARALDVVGVFRRRR